jgi:hypothetical protein
MRPDVIVDNLIGRISKNPIRWALWVGLTAFIVGGGLFSLVEKDASLIDGWYWATVVMPTVGFGDFSPATVAGRWLYVYVVASGWFSTLILGGALAGRITERRVNHAGDLHNDFDDVIDRLRGLRQAYAADEARDDTIMLAAQKCADEWRRVGHVPDGCDGLDSAMYDLGRALEDNHQEVKNHHA